MIWLWYFFSTENLTFLAKSGSLYVVTSKSLIYVNNTHIHFLCIRSHKRQNLNKISYLSKTCHHIQSVQLKKKYAGRMDHRSNCKCHRASGMRCTVGGMHTELRMAPIIKCSAPNKMKLVCRETILSWRLHRKYQRLHTCFYFKVTRVKDPGILLQDIVHLSFRYSKFVTTVRSCSSVFNIVAWLQYESPSDYGWIPGTGKKFVSSSTRPYWLVGLPGPSIQPTRQALSRVSKTIGAWGWPSLPSVSRWRISEAVSPLKQMPSWRVWRQLYPDCDYTVFIIWKFIKRKRD